MQLKVHPQDFLVREVITLDFQPGSFATYLLQKQDKNTEDVLQDIARMLRLQRKDIGFCGTKDKIAITEQYITIKGGPQNIRSPQSYFLAYLGQRKEPLRLGMHERNQFTITIRDVHTNPVVQPLKNYFGEQRFGTNNVAIGLALVKKQYKEAATLLQLSFTTDPISALRAIPRSTLLLYVHSVQSFLWNELAKKLPSEPMDVPLPGFAPQGTPEQLAAMDTLLTSYQLKRMSFVDRSFPEVSVEGGTRPLLQDVRDLSVSAIVDGVCIVSFSLAPGQYATETVKQLFPQE